MSAECPRVRAALLGEAPPLPLDAHLAGCDGCRALAEELEAIDRAAREALGPVEPPEALSRAVLAAVEREARGGGRRAGAWLGLGAAAALLAAGALLAVRPEPPAAPGTLVERGVGPRLPDVALKVAVSEGGRLARLVRGRAYPPGTELYFRAGLDAPAWLALVRVDRDGVLLVHEQRGQAAEADLSVDGAPLAWRLEAGEGDAVFALLASPAPLDRAAVEATLSGAYDAGKPGRVCEAARTLGARCAAVEVGVEP